MSETKFTPGPWTVNLAHRIPLQIKNADHGTIGAACLGGRTESESAANALVMAAAPELYEALAECLERGGTTRGEWMPQDTYDKARAALKKARGDK